MFSHPEKPEVHSASDLNQSSKVSSSPPFSRGQAIIILIFKILFSPFISCPPQQLLNQSAFSSGYLCCIICQRGSIEERKRKLKIKYQHILVEALYFLEYLSEGSTKGYQETMSSKDTDTTMPSKNRATFTPCSPS